MKWQINEPKPVIECEQKFEVYLPEHVYAKMMGYIDAVDGEISGMGEVVKEGNLYTVKDIWLLKQECTGASTRIDAISLADLRAEVFAQGKAQDGFQLWWHSHANMETFWSGTDKSTMQMFLADIPWMLFIVANKKRSFRARVEFKEPFVAAWEDIPVSVETAIFYDKVAIEEEVKAKVKSNSYRGGGFSSTHRAPYSPMEREFFNEGGSYVPPGTHISTPDYNDHMASRYWSRLSKKERKAVRRYANEDEPMVVFHDCQICKKKNYVFYIKRLKQVICLEDVERIDKAAQKNIKITHATAPLEPEDVGLKADTKKDDENPTPPGLNQQETT